jgi:hypothetical protein
VEGIGTGAGLAALGFWLFIGIIIAAGVWDNIRKRESQHETLRRVVESGQPIDESLTDKLLAITSGAQNKDLDRDLRISGWIVWSLAPGMLLLGWFLARATEPELLGVLAGVAALMVCLGSGLMIAARVVQTRYSESTEDAAA